MNNINLIGRLTKDPVISYTSDKTAIARFTVAIDRGKDKDGNDRGADFPNVVAFRKTAEFVEKWLKKGQLVGITGHIQTGSYEKNGQKVYTTDVIADNLTMIDWGDRPKAQDEKPKAQTETQAEFIPDDDIPF